jgi:alpha-beta hydrolase superfamily lysophospholipase
VPLRTLAVRQPRGVVRHCRRGAPVVAALLLALATLVAGSGGAGAETAKGTPRVIWVDQHVTFMAGGMPIYGTFRHPTTGPSVPGVLLIAGSGPTDRNGNNANYPGKIDTLKTLADWLSADGVASLRYDKLGSGKTGLGPYASDQDAIGIAPYEQEAAAALTFLAAQNGIEDSRLGVFGHSEGALFALLTATGNSGPVPAIHALGLLEPLPERYLTLTAQQFEAQITAEKADHSLSASNASQAEALLDSTIAQLRASGTVQGYPADGIGDVLNPSTATFMSQADRFDPATLAAQLPRGTPVLVSCSDADIVISCAQVAHLRQGLAEAHANVDSVRLHDVDHVLKVDPSRSGNEYALALPFSPQLKVALASFVRENLLSKRPR